MDMRTHLFYENLREIKIHLLRTSPSLESTIDDYEYLSWYLIGAYVIFLSPKFNRLQLLQRNWDEICGKKILQVVTKGL